MRQLLGRLFRCAGLRACYYVDMVLVDQSKLYSPQGIHNGNCLSACLASILEVPLWMVPPFEDVFGRNDWRPRVDQWLSRFFNHTLVRVEGHKGGVPGEYYIANGRSSRGVYHSVVFKDGEVVHDPHWSRAGIEEVEWCWHLEPAIREDRDPGRLFRDSLGRVWELQGEVRALPTEEVVERLRSSTIGVGDLVYVPLYPLETASFRRVS